MSAAAAFTKPLPLPQAAWRRRLEVFSPKLERRMSLGSYNAWRCWVALEANPAITGFCERPAREAGHNSAMIDFWVQLKGEPRGEFWWIQSGDVEAAKEAGAQDGSQLPPPKRLHDLPVRQISGEVIASWQVPLANWAQILPYLVSFRGHRQPLLEQSLVVQLGHFTRLSHLLDQFAEHDPSEVQAALYFLLANGRVLSPDIAAAPLSGATRFRRV